MDMSLVSGCTTFLKRRRLSADICSVEQNIAAELEALRRANELRDRQAASRRKKIIVGLLLAVLASCSCGAQGVWTLSWHRSG
jgi:hypothetical protein